jgi:hypothetical protein
MVYEVDVRNGVWKNIRRQRWGVVKAQERKHNDTREIGSEREIFGKGLSGAWSGCYTWALPGGSECHRMHMTCDK